MATATDEPAPQMRTITVRVPLETYDKLEQARIYERRDNTSQMVRVALDNYLLTMAEVIAAATRKG